MSALGNTIAAHGAMWITPFDPVPADCTSYRSHIDDAACLNPSNRSMDQLEHSSSNTKGMLTLTGGIAAAAISGVVSGIVMKGWGG